MAKLSGREIQKAASNLIRNSPSGIRYTDLVRQIVQQNPGTETNTVCGNVFDLHRKFPKEIAKRTRGLFTPVGIPEPDDVVETKETVAENKFYEPFADWLKNDLDEATDAIALGGSAMGRKWGTPDVVGVYRPLASNLIKFPPEIISVEIKIDRQQPVVAFGQAVAYRLFSTKTYIVMPASISPEDQDRLEALCLLCGIGLVLFTEANVKEPSFSIRVRAQRFSPDMFYVNEFAERLKDSDPAKFNSLFG